MAMRLFGAWSGCCVAAVRLIGGPVFGEQLWLRSFHTHKESGLLVAAAGRACKSDDVQSDPSAHARAVYFTSQVRPW